MATLGLDATSYHAEAKLAELRAITTGKAIMQGLSPIGHRLKGAFEGVAEIMRPVAALATMAAVEEAGRKTLEYSHMIAELSKRTGQSTDTLQEWDFAATKANIPLEVLINSFEKFQIAQAKARGGDKEAIAALTRLGLNHEQISNLKDAAGNFEVIGDRIKGAEINGQMLKDIVLAFGRAGRDVIPVFKNDLREAAEEARRLGALMSPKEISAGAEASERLKMAWFQIRPLVAEVVGFMATRVGEIADFFRLTIGVMIVDLEARKNATKRGDTFWDRTKENWHGQKDAPIDVDKVAADARKKYIDRIMEERQAREAQIKKMEADFKNPKPLPPYTIPDEKIAGEKELNREKDKLFDKQQANDLAALGREGQLLELQRRRLTIMQLMAAITTEEGRTKAAMDIEDIDAHIRRLTDSGSVEHLKAPRAAHHDVNALQRIGAFTTGPSHDPAHETLKRIEAHISKFTPKQHESGWTRPIF